jgi:phthiocerol/phenolphthiocerol synthesis type-I polyketide synthase E
MPSSAQMTLVAPKNDLESQLAALWKPLFGLSEIGTDQNYFELGGDSLMAVRLCQQMEAIFQVRIPLSALVESPTIGQLAGFIARGREGLRPAFSHLVPIQAHGTRPPFFCVHGAGGTVLSYVDLARRLGPEQPVYGLQSQGLDGKSPFLTRIEDMAAAYVKEVRTLQPKGPYYLGGYCMGGTIAYEMARQLKAQGQEVALLALMDTLNWANAKPKTWADSFSVAAQKIYFHLRNFLLLSAKNKLTFFREKTKVLRGRLAIRFGSLRRTARTDRAPVDLAGLWQTNDVALLAYTPRPYAGRIVHFRPARQYSLDALPEREWDGLAQLGVEKIVLPVYPAGMLLEPFVETLAARLAPYLNRAPFASEVSRVRRLPRT